MQLSPSENKLTGLDIIVMILSIYIFGALAVETFFQLPSEISHLIRITDHLICVFFLVEFSVRFYSAENKLKFMKWGWIDLLASIPVLDYTRAGRIVRLIRILRIARAFHSTKKLIEHVFRNKAAGAFTTLPVIALLFIIFSSMIILQVETSPESKIKTAEDALWWAFGAFSYTTYGDKIPLTTEGRILAMLLKTVGLGLYGVFSGYIASWFLQNKKKEDR